jgi:hypothetical protein
MLSFERSPGSVDAVGHTARRIQSSAASPSTVRFPGLRPSWTSSCFPNLAHVAGRLLDAKRPAGPPFRVRCSSSTPKGNQAGFANVSNGIWQDAVSTRARYKVEFGPFFPGHTVPQWRRPARPRRPCAGHNTLHRPGRDRPTTSRRLLSLPAGGTVTLSVLVQHGNRKAPVSYWRQHRLRRRSHVFRRQQRNADPRSRCMPAPCRCSVWPDTTTTYACSKRLWTVVSGQNHDACKTDRRSARPRSTTTVRDSAELARPLRNICVSRHQRGRFPYRPAKRRTGRLATNSEWPDTRCSGSGPGSYNVSRLLPNGGPCTATSGFGPTGGTGLKQNARVTNPDHGGQAATIPLTSRWTRTGILTASFRDNRRTGPRFRRGRELGYIGRPAGEVP